MFIVFSEPLAAIWAAAGEPHIKPIRKTAIIDRNLGDKSRSSNLKMRVSKESVLKVQNITFDHIFICVICVICA
jgi:hypothetical protein